MGVKKHLPEILYPTISEKAPLNPGYTINAINITPKIKIHGKKVIKKGN
jgi:hypothetical protein